MTADVSIYDKLLQDYCIPRIGWWEAAGVKRFSGIPIYPSSRGHYLAVNQPRPYLLGGMLLFHMSRYIFQPPPAFL